MTCASQERDAAGHPQSGWRNPSQDGDRTNHPHPHPESLLRFIKHDNVFICYTIRHLEFWKCLKVGLGMVCVVPSGGGTCTWGWAEVWRTGGAKWHCKVVVVVVVVVVVHVSGVDVWDALVSDATGCFQMYDQFSKVHSWKMGPAPGRFERSKGILEGT